MSGESESRPRLRRWLVPHSFWLRGLLALFVIAAILFLSHTVWMPAAGRWLDVGEAPRPTDDCLVLSGDYEQRPFGAAALYLRGYIRQKIWLTLVAAGPRDLREEPTIEAAVRHLLVVLGVPGNGSRCLTVSAHRRSTRPGPWPALDAEPTATVTLSLRITTPRRSRWVFRHVLGDRADRLRFFSVPTDNFNANCWWHSGEGFSLYTNEYLKLAFYLIRYGSAGWWLGAFFSPSSGSGFGDFARRRKNASKR